MTTQFVEEKQNIKISKIFSIKNIDLERMVIARQDKNSQHTIEIKKEDFNAFCSLLQYLPENKYVDIKQLVKIISQKRPDFNIPLELTKSDFRKAHAILGILSDEAGLFSFSKSNKYSYTKHKNDNFSNLVTNFWQQTLSKTVCSKSNGDTHPLNHPSKISGTNIMH
jgi:hypothetical protein